MAIQPIDLQTLYAQLDKISKTQVQQQQGAQLQNAIQQEEIQKKNMQKKAAVEQTEKLETGVGVVKDRKKSGNNQDTASAGEKKQEQSAPEPAAAETEVITDPGLGLHVDISG